MDTNDGSLHPWHEISSMEETSQGKISFLKRRAKKSRVGTLTWSQLYQKKKKHS